MDHDIERTYYPQVQRFLARMAMQGVSPDDVARMIERMPSEDWSRMMARAAEEVARS